MSYCEIIAFRDGKPAESVEYGNSWGGAAFVWNAIYNDYLKDPTKEFDNWLTSASRNESPLWSIAERADIPLFIRAVHMATFDRAIVRREHFAEYAAHLREFVSRYPPGNKVCHLLEWAEFVEKCDAEAIGFYGNSVSENLWHDYNGELDESVPYDLNTGTEHREVYDELVTSDPEPNK